MITQSRLITVKDYFLDNVSEYLDIANRLKHIKRLYLDAKPDDKARMWFNAYLFAVLSVQMPVKRHEKAFRILIDNMPEICDYVDPKKVEYWLRKAGHGFYNTIPKRISNVARKLLDGDIDINITDRKIKSMRKAYHPKLDGLGYIKISFLFAMLGFKAVCIDTWVAKYLKIDYQNGESIRLSRNLRFYESHENTIKAESRKTIGQYTENPFLYQWILFDYSRMTGITYHDVYFEATESLKYARCDKGSVS